MGRLKSFFDEEMLFFCFIGVSMVLLVYLAIQMYLWITGRG